MRNLIGDAGHGGKDSGAVSIDGDVLEKDITLIVTNRTCEIIKEQLVLNGFHRNYVHKTRSTDVFLSLQKRVQLANELAADSFSVHCNAGKGDGIEIFTSRGQTSSDSWADELYKQAEKFLPNQVQRTDFSDGDADKEAGFTVLRNKHSAVLIELGFIDTEKGEAFLSNPANMERLSQWIASATLKNRFNLVMKSNIPPSQILPITEEDKLEILWQKHLNS